MMGPRDMEDVVTISMPVESDANDLLNRDPRPARSAGAAGAGQQLKAAAKDAGKDAAKTESASPATR
jgi:hypothetical protein